MTKLLFSYVFFSISLLSNAQSALIWAKGFGDINTDQANSLTFDLNGNVIVTGNFEGNVDFDPGPSVYYLNSNTLRNAFVLKLDPLGNLIWAKQFEANTGSLYSLKIKVDGLGNIYTTGNYSGTVDFDPGPGTYTLSTPSTGFTYYGYISKLDANGNFLWVRSLGNGTISSAYTDVVIDDLRNVFLTGSFEGTVDFDPGAGNYLLASGIRKDIFVSKLDSMGNFIFAEKIGSSGGQGSSICLNSSKDVLISGSFYQGTSDFDPGPGIFNLICNTNTTDAFVLKLDSSGGFEWAKSLTSIGASRIDLWEMQLDPADNIVMTGSFNDTVDFDPGPTSFTMTESGGWDAFVCKLNSSGQFLWSKQIGSPTSGFDRGYSITTDLGGSIYVTGKFFGTADFDPGPLVSNLTSKGATDIFIEKLDANGNYVYSQQIGEATSSALANSIRVDASGNICLAGFYGIGTIDFDPGVNTNNISSNGGNDIFIMKLNNTVGVKENYILNGSYLFPNPSEGIFYFQLKEESNVIITNVCGQEILNEKRNSGKQIIDLKDQSDGIYFVKVIQAGKQYVSKIIKE